MNYPRFRRLFIIISAFLVVNTACNKKSKLADYPIQPVPFTSVNLTDNFWAPKIKKNADVTIPIAFRYCKSTGRIKNFEIAGGLDTGKFQTAYPFDDSDVFKIIEGASYSLQTYTDTRLEAFLDTLIYKIGLAQEDDGYLYTNRTIATINKGEGLHPWAGMNRWELDSMHSHELYNAGHLYEAAVAHYQATGKNTLLDIAVRSADLVYRDFGWDRVRVYPGHQGIEMGLIKLYRTTGEKKYLDLARFFLEVRGPDGSQYNQAHLKPVDQNEAVGHSVRAAYMYSGMADIAAIEKDSSFLNAIMKIWEDIVHRKMYITGGIGSSGNNEGFAEPFVLPNMPAYCETCASVASIFTNHRLFLLTGRKKYIDVLEKTLYNSMLSGVSLSGERFFYSNPLESNGQHHRKEWYGCACCPSNIARFLPAVPGYVYAFSRNELYVNLFISNYADITLDKEKVRISQKTNFPWDGKVEVFVNPETHEKFDLKIRVPGWALNEALPGDLYKFDCKNTESLRLLVNGEDIEAVIVDGYAVISRNWKPKDKVEIVFPMPARTVLADAKVKEDKDKMAVQRGPLIYCTEWPDNNTGNILDIMIRKDAVFTTDFVPELLGGTQVIRTTGFQTRRTIDGKIRMLNEEPVILIPYSLWNNRGAGEMMVWIPVSPEATHPLPAPTIARSSKVRASKMTETISAVNDQIEPVSSDDHAVLNYNWRPDRDRWEWVEYDFEKPLTISKSKVYWFDDGPDGECRIPDDWEILYLNGNIWEPVIARTPYTVIKDDWNYLVFKPVKASAVKIKVKLKKDFSAGIYEWIIE